MGRAILPQVSVKTRDCPTVTQSPVISDLPTDILGHLSGLRWEMPNSPFIPDNGEYDNCINPEPQTITLEGDSSRLYQVTLLIRGLFEYKSYIGGIPGEDPHVLVDATGYTDNAFNIYSLSTSDPVHRYFLNSGVSAYPLFGTRYTLTVPMKGGSQLTLYMSSMDGAEITNQTGIILTADPGDPPFLTTPQPYYGQFMQMDVLSIV